MRPRFSAGDRVLVATRSVPGHCRTPSYLRGHEGRVRSLLGSYRNPEDLAYGGSGLPTVPLYWVEIDMPKLWPDYRGEPQDVLLVEIYEHWLTPPPQEQ